MMSACAGISCGCSRSLRWEQHVDQTSYLALRGSHRCHSPCRTGLNLPRESVDAKLPRPARCRLQEGPGRGECGSVIGRFAATCFAHSPCGHGEERSRPHRPDYARKFPSPLFLEKHSSPRKAVTCAREAEIPEVRISFRAGSVLLP